jgi:hypothetical protein
MSIDVYKSALEQAKKDLTEVTREFESARTRKELMEKLFDALTQLTLYLNPVEEPTAAPEDAAHEVSTTGAAEESVEAAGHEVSETGVPEEAAVQEVSATEAPEEAEQAVAHEAPATEAPEEAVHEVAATEAREGAEAAEDEVQVLQEG